MTFLNWAVNTVKSEYCGAIGVTVSGESHSREMTCKLTGIPAGMPVEREAVINMLKRRAATDSAFSTSRLENDMPVSVTGIKDGFTCGGDITAVFENRNTDSEAYSAGSFVPRPSHADYPLYVKTGAIPPGGGHCSGRLTLPLTFAGAVCKCVLKSLGVEIGAHIASVGNVYDERFNPADITADEILAPAEKSFPVISDEKGSEMLRVINDVKQCGDSLGGVVECAVTGLPVGKGNHMFFGVENVVSSLMFAIPGLKGIEFGSGFYGSELRGSENNDEFTFDGDEIRTLTNNHGGILGGFTSGMPMVFRCAFKPVPSIKKSQRSVNLKDGTSTFTSLEGRFDSCFVPRAVPVTEAVAAIAVLDLMLRGSRVSSLAEARARIDVYDTAITELLTKRAQLSLDVAAFKERDGINTFDKSREGDIIARIEALTDVEVSSAVSAVYREILVQSRLLQDEKRNKK